MPKRTEARSGGPAEGVYSSDSVCRFCGPYCAGHHRAGCSTSSWGNSGAERVTALDERAGTVTVASKRMDPIVPRSNPETSEEVELHSSELTSRWALSSEGRSSVVRTCGL